MSGAGFKFALALIGVLAFSAIAAPWLGLRDPNEQLDGLVLPDLAPLTRVDAVDESHTASTNFVQESLRRRARPATSP